MRLPVLAAARPEENQVETVSYNGETYLVCGKWNLQGERISMKLVQKPVPGSILVNGELAPTAEQKKALAAVEGAQDLCAGGTECRL